MLHFAEDSIYHPIDGRGANAIASADGGALKVLDYVFDKGKLDVRRVVNSDEFVPAFGVETNGGVSEDGETDGTLVADDLDAVFFGRFMPHKAPTT